MTPSVLNSQKRKLYTTDLVCSLAGLLLIAPLLLSLWLDLKILLKTIVFVLKKVEAS